MNGYCCSHNYNKIIEDSRSHNLGIVNDKNLFNVNCGWGDEDDFKDENNRNGQELNSYFRNDRNDSFQPYFYKIYLILSRRNKVFFVYFNWKKLMI